MIFIYVVCVLCVSKWSVCMTDVTYEFVYLCVVYDVCTACMCVCKTAVHICGASCLCVCSVRDRWGVILECLCAFRGPMETSSRKDASSMLLMEEASSQGYKMCICKVKRQSG